MNNSLQTQQKTNFSNYVTAPAMQEKIKSMVGGKDALEFQTALISVVSNNLGLQACENYSLVAFALTAWSLKLSFSPVLNHVYAVPFHDRKNNRTVAQFQMGYKGYIQLAIRSGYYKKLNVLSIKKGELVKYNPLEEELEVNLIEDDEVREKSETIGYYAMFEYNNGFRKTMYWSKEKMRNHAINYSQGYKNDVSKGTTYTYWSKSFDEMAYKTLIRQLISKWGIMSIEFQKAFESDMTVEDKNGNKEYVDSDILSPNKNYQESKEIIVEQENGEYQGEL